MEDKTRVTNTSPSAQVSTEFAGAVPYLYVAHADTAIEFYKAAFGAKELIRLHDDKNRVVHCELDVGKSKIMLSDEFPEMNCLSPQSLGGTTSGFTLYFEDATSIFINAIKNGAKEIRKIEKQFCGDLEGKIEDPFGHQWFIATHVEDVPYDVMKERAAETLKLH